MSMWLNYIVEANIGLLLLLAVYKLVLSKETNFGAVRLMLLAGVAACLIFPLFHFEDANVTIPLSVGSALPSYWLPEVAIADEVTKGSGRPAAAFWQYVAILYCLGLVVCLSGVLMQLTRLLYVIAKARTYRVQRLRIAESDEDKPVFSFFCFIFIGKAHQLSTQEKQQIILHESTHARRWHSFDILLFSMLRVCFWFNPFINTYKKIFIQLHEFEADARAVEHTDVNKYCSLLARVALHSAGLSLANHFNNSLIIKRIEMMRTIKNNISPWKIAVSSLVIPAAFLLLSCQDQVSSTQAEMNSAPVVVDEHAYPEGGLDKFYNDVRRNVTYPASARTDHKYGKVLIQFVVNEDGTLSDLETLDSPDPVLGEEVKRVLSLASKWVPAKKDGISVKEQLVFPVNFLLDFPGKRIDAARSAVTLEANSSSLNEIVVVGYAK